MEFERTQAVDRIGTQIDITIGTGVGTAAVGTAAHICHVCGTVAVRTVHRRLEMAVDVSLERRLHFESLSAALDDALEGTGPGVLLQYVPLQPVPRGGALPVDFAALP
jgi:hypothetical protein